jgi:hypothetical protein
MYDGPIASEQSRGGASSLRLRSRYWVVRKPIRAQSRERTAYAHDDTGRARAGLDPVRTCDLSTIT